MGSFTHFIKTLAIPLGISLAIYIVLSLLLLPLIRRTRARYAEYIPVDRISAHTSSLRDRFTHGMITAIVAPSRWARRKLFRRRSAMEDEEDAFDEEAGEGLVGFDIEAQQGGVLGRQHPSHQMGVGRGRMAGRGLHQSIASDASDARLSRDLEEVFRDDSDEEDERQRLGGR